MDLLGKIQGMLVGGLMLLVAAMAFYILLQDRSIDDLRRERNEAVRQRQAAERTMVVMADQHAAALRRTQVHGETRTEILSGPATDDGDVSPILMRSMRGADRLGGIPK